MQGKFRLTSDFVLAFAALFISTFIWLIAKQGDITTESVSPIKIYTMNIPDNIEIKIPQEDVVIEVQYPKAQKKFIISSNFKLIIDFRSENIEAGAGIEQAKPIQYPITVNNIHMSDEMPPGVKVIGIRDPKNLWIQAKILTISAEVSPAIVGEPAAGYLFKKALVEGKNTVTLTGPKKTIKESVENSESVPVVETEPIDIAGKTDNFLKTVSLKIPQPFRIVSTENEQINVNIVIEEKIGKRLMDKVPISIPSLSENLIAVCNPSSINITVEGPISLIDKIGKNSFVFNTKQAIEESEGYAGKYAIEAKFSDTVERTVREKTQIIKMEPPDVEINFKDKKALE